MGDDDKHLTQIFPMPTRNPDGRWLERLLDSAYYYDDKPHQMWNDFRKLALERGDEKLAAVFDARYMGNPDGTPPEDSGAFFEHTTIEEIASWLEDVADSAEGEPGNYAWNLNVAAKRLRRAFGGNPDGPSEPPRKDGT